MGLNKSMERLSAVIKDKQNTSENDAPKKESRSHSSKAMVDGRGHSRENLKFSARTKLRKATEKSRVSITAIHPKNEFPTILTRLPVFLPIPAKKQNQLFDKDNAYRFSTSWGYGRRLGPPLTVYDEDTFIALGALRQLKLKGRGDELPVPISSNQMINGCHALICTVSDIQDVLKLQCGGVNIKRRLESIRRLNATTIELVKKDKFGNETGAPIQLLSVNWKSYNEDGVVYVQFSQQVSKFLEENYSYVDLSVRMQLSDTGKAIHRFMSGQNKNYKIGLNKLMEAVGYCREVKYFRRELSETLDKLSSIGWIKKSEITGSGRKTPFLLSIQR